MQRAWIAGIARDAQRVGRPIHLQDRPTQRRAAIVRGLVTLAGGGHDDDEIVRAIVATTLKDDEPAQFVALPAGQIVSILWHPEAQQFALLCEAFTTGRMQATVDNDGRLIFEEVKG